MTIENVVSIYGKSLGKNLVVRRRLESNSSFKVYKTLTIELYEIIHKQPSLITSFQTSEKATENQMKSFIEKSEKEFLTKVFTAYGDK